MKERHEKDRIQERLGGKDEGDKTREGMSDRDMRKKESKRWAEEGVKGGEGTERTRKRVLTYKNGGNTGRAEAQWWALRLLPGSLRFSTEGLEVGSEGVAEGGAQLRPTHRPVH